MIRGMETKDQATPLKRTPWKWVALGAGFIVLLAVALAVWAPWRGGGGGAGGSGGGGVVGGPGEEEARREAARVEAERRVAAEWAEELFDLPLADAPPVTRVTLNLQEVEPMEAWSAWAMEAGVKVRLGDDLIEREGVGKAEAVTLRTQERSAAGVYADLVAATGWEAESVNAEMLLRGHRSLVLDGTPVMPRPRVESMQSVVEVASMGWRGEGPRPMLSIGLMVLFDPAMTVGSMPTSPLLLMAVDDKGKDLLNPRWDYEPTMQGENVYLGSRRWWGAPVSMALMHPADGAVAVMELEGIVPVVVYEKLEEVRVEADEAGGTVELDDTVVRMSVRDGGDAWIAEAHMNLPTREDGEMALGARERVAHLFRDVAMIDKEGQRVAAEQPYRGLVFQVSKTRLPERPAAVQWRYAKGLSVHMVPFLFRDLPLPPKPGV